MSIYEKLNKVMQKVAFVTKDTTVGSGARSYKGVSHDKVTEIIRPHFVEHGILTIPFQVEKGVTVAGKTQAGNDKIRFEAVYDVAFIDCEDANSKIVVRVEAHAEGSDDKCAGKALSYAVKSAMLKVLMLETGENDEEGIKNTIDTKQAGMLAQLIADTNTDMTKFQEAYQISKVSDLPSGMFAQALGQLQTKAKKLKADNATQNNSN
jgi:hypothetical protein